MSYRLLPHVQLVLVRDRDGLVQYHYQASVHNAFGPIIPWLNDQQREQFLAEGLVEEIADPEQSPPGVRTSSDPWPPAADSAADTGAVGNCVAALDRLNAAPDAGAPSCRGALRDAGFRFGNGIVAAAVKVRKEQSAAVPDSAR